MKKLLLLASVILGSCGAYAQGYLNFANAAAGVNAPVRDTSSGNPGVLLSGPGFQAQLWVGPSGTVDASVMTNNAAGVSTSFNTGAQAGYFTGGHTVVNGAAPGTVITAQVRAWNVASGATYQTATDRGTSILFQVTLGGPSPAADPPMTGLGNNAFTIAQTVPEPSSIALGLLGLGAIALFRRRK